MENHMKSSDTSRCFITGCDSNTEWMLRWFAKNYAKHNDTEIGFVDFGVTEEMRAWVYQESPFNFIVDVPRQRVNGWFLKPKALMKTPREEVCWVDTDIHVLGDISGIFNYLEEGKLAMVEDKPWSKRRGETWHNSGIVGIKGKPPILSDWVNACYESPKVGDQEVLHEMLMESPLKRISNIVDLPNIYNWLRIQLLDGNDNPNKLCMHWTGQKGKLEIRKLIYNG